MEYLRQVDLESLKNSKGHFSQFLLTRDSGATTCKIMISKQVPGGGSPRGTHTHTFDQIFYVMEGTLWLEIDGAQSKAGPGTLVVFPAGTKHRNYVPIEATEPATFLEFMAPLPAYGETRESAASYVDPATGHWVHPVSTPKVAKPGA